MHAWFLWNWVALNVNKSEAILFGTCGYSFSCHCWLSSAIISNKHTSSISQSMFFHVRSLRHVCPHWLMTLQLLLRSLSTRYHLPTWCAPLRWYYLETSIAYCAALCRMCIPHYCHIANGTESNGTDRQTDCSIALCRPTVGLGIIMMHIVAVLCIGSQVDMVHCIVDRNLITGQNEQSTVIAIQNVILACSLQYVSVCCFLSVLCYLLLLSYYVLKRNCPNEKLNTGW